MGEEKKQKKTEEQLWREVLYSSDFKSIEEALKILREKGNINILPDVFNIYKAYKGKDLGGKIYNFLSDIKCSQAVPLIINLIGNNEYRSIRQDLLQLCWQTRLDFSAYFEKFIDIFIKEDLTTAFEAFTVLEYMDIKNTEVLKKGISKLEQSISDIDESKKELLVDLVNILRKKENISEEN
jgi:hypothetical protein